MSGLSTTWAEACDTPAQPLQPLAFGQFLTPTGKVELKSTVLEALGCDPLPYYVDIHAEADEAHAAGYPYEIFAGAREEANYNTNLHQIDFLRKRALEPELYINPADAHRENLTDGQWARVGTAHGAIELRTRIDEAQPAGTLRIPHGWWKPELNPGAATGYSGAEYHNDGILFGDEPDMLDAEQGLANLRGGVYAKVEAL